MPEYLAPAVYVEETSFRAKSIEGVSTSTTGFVGPTRKGPVSVDEDTIETPELITSFGDFERIYGGFNDLEFTAGRATNFIANAVKNYFDNGGSRLFVARVPSGGAIAASVFVGGDADNANNLRFVARSAGAVGNGRITLSRVRVDASPLAMRRVPNGTLLDDGTNLYRKRERDWVQQDDSEYLFDETNNSWADSGGTAFPALAAAAPQFVSLNVLAVDGEGNESFYEDLGLIEGHPRYIGQVLNQIPNRRIDHLQNTYAIELGNSVEGFRVYEILNAAVGAPLALTGGSDGAEPTSAAYTAPLLSLALNEDISIIAAPGYSSFADSAAIELALLTHAEQRRAYRMAVLDTPPEQTVTQALAVKSRLDSSYGAIYHPWVITANPLSQPGNESIAREIALPPSGFVCGIYARNDNDKGVSKSPGNEVVRGALRFQTDISFREQEVLNPRGVNCLRFFPGRGNRLWGARTLSSDPEWKYVGPRRYFIYLESSIDRSTQWAVFENNGPLLWANITETVKSFLYNEWISGALLGASTDEAYFVRCDRTTMTQNDLDNGRLICLVGVAALKPAEFVIFRIGQKTADARS